MANKLIPSNHIKSMINRYKPLKKDEEIKWMEEYKNNKSGNKATEVLLNGVSKLFASAIYKNENKFLASVPEATYDDLFQQMCMMFLKKLPEFNPHRSKLNTWATWQIMPLVKTPVKVMGDKFARTHKMVNIDKPLDVNGNSIATTLPDGSASVEDRFTTGSEKDRLTKAMKKLSKEDQEIILNFYGFVRPKKEWQSKTGKINAASIARGMGQPADKIRSRIAKIKKQLVKYLNQSSHRKYFDVDSYIRDYERRNKGSRIRLKDLILWEEKK